MPIDETELFDLYPCSETIRAAFARNIGLAIAGIAPSPERKKLNDEPSKLLGLPVPQLEPKRTGQRNSKDIPDDMADDEMICIDQWAKLCGVTKRQILRWQSAGQMPPPDLNLGQIRRWKKSTYRAWMEQRAAVGRPQ